MNWKTHRGDSTFTRVSSFHSAWIWWRMGRDTQDNKIFPNRKNLQERLGSVIYNLIELSSMVHTVREGIIG
jgi:hypothetical protein